MADIKELLATLTPSSQVVDDVHSRVQEVISHFENVSAQMSGMGFEGVAANLYQIRDMLVEVVGMLATLAGYHDEALTATGRITPTTTPRDAIDLLSTVQDRPDRH